MSLLGVLGRGFGVGVGKAATLVITDLADGTGATATISGGRAGATNRLYYCLRSGGGWVLAGTITGAGSISLALPIGSYVGHVLSDGAAVSSLVSFAVTDVASVATDAPHIEAALRNERVQFRV